MSPSSSDEVQRLQALERENRLLREETRQAQRIRRMWESSVSQLKQARAELLATQHELEEANRDLQARVDELGRAKGHLEQLAYSDKQVIEHMAEGVVTTDLSGTILAVNPAFTRVTGYSAEEVIGQNPRLLKSHRHDDAFYAEMWRRLAVEGEWQGEIWNRRKDGEVYPEHLSVSAIRDWDGSVVNYIGVFIDISESKRIEAELIAARNEALEASRLKSEFLANMSHEVRTPMNAIIGMADLLSETPLDEEQRRYVGIFRSAGDLLLSLIDDILDLAKVEAGQMGLERIDYNLPGVVEDVIDVVAVRARDKGLALGCTFGERVPQVVMGDPVRLRQILLNLIGNAIKFTDQGAVSVRVECDAERPGYLWFAVSDSGAGIPPERQARIFDAFTQVDASVTRRFGGTGLGLTISQRLVALMGGLIWLESEVGQGSTFYFSIPAEVPEALPEVAPVAWPRIARSRLLVAGRSHGSRQVAIELLRSTGAVVEEVDGPEWVVSTQSRERFDALVVDAQPDGSACLDAVKGVRALPGCAALPVVLLCSSDQVRFATGVGAHPLIKPVIRRELMEALDSALATSAAAAERPLRILLAEDSPDNVLLIRAYLKRTPHTVEVVENGLLAVERVRETPPDLILMDVQMPVMDGYAATRLIRDWERETGRAPLPIIALTAHAMVEDEARSRAAGCDEHLTKPVRKREFLAVIRRYAE